MSQRLINRLPKRFKYAVHNIVGHPLMEIANWYGCYRLASYIHDITLPKEWEKDYENSWDVGESTNL